MVNQSTFIPLAISIPIINILLDMLMIFYPDLKSQAGFIRTAFLLFIIIYFFIIYGLEKTRYNISLLFYILFILILTLQTSDLKESLIDGFLKISISFLMIPIGMQLGKTKNVKITKSLYFVIFILIINYILSQIYKIGVSTYHEDSFYQGGASVTAPIIIGCIMLVFFNAYNTKRLPYSKILNLIIITMSILIILVSMKRGANLGFFVGALVYLLVSAKKAGTLMRFGIVAFGLFILSSEYSDTLQQRFDARSTEKNLIQNENRYKETFYVAEEMSNSTLFKVLLGDEAFNSKYVMRKYFGRERQLHVDYNILIHGTGIIGLLFYLYLFYIFLQLSLSIKRSSSFVKDPNYRNLISENHALVLSLISLSLVMSISGGIQFVSYRVILFFIIGFFIGEMMKLRNHKLSEIHKKEVASPTEYI